MTTPAETTATTLTREPALGASDLFQLPSGMDVFNWVYTNALGWMSENWLLAGLGVVGLTVVWLWKVIGEALTDV